MHESQTTDPTSVAMVQDTRACWQQRLDESRQPQYTRGGGYHVDETHT